MEEEKKYNHHKIQGPIIFINLLLALAASFILLITYIPNIFIVIIIFIISFIILTKLKNKKLIFIFFILTILGYIYTLWPSITPIKILNVYTDLNPLERKLCGSKLDWNTNIVGKFISDDIIIYADYSKIYGLTDTDETEYYDKNGNLICSYNHYVGDFIKCEKTIQRMIPDFNRFKKNWTTICSNNEKSPIKFYYTLPVPR